MKRIFNEKLIKWKNKLNRKPLLVKGVRQVGKTFSLKKFGESQFPQYHYFNFEKEPNLANLFEKNLDPRRIINELSFYKNSVIDIKHDLVIFDEIQACPKALNSLKYFQEDMPELALCSAGSLLGVHLNSEPFPVGKVDMMHMYPMTFEEFIEGINDDSSADFLKKFNNGREIPAVIHEHLWEQLKLYFIVGGLPDVVEAYNKSKDDLFSALQIVRNKQHELIQAYYADMAKHAGKVNAMHLDRLWRSVPRQLAREENGGAGKFKFKDIIPGIDRYSRLVNVIDWLEAAGLIIKASIVHKARLPLSAFTKENSFKLFMFDVGILGAMSDLSPKVIWNYDYGSYKGYFAENFVAQELVAATDSQLYSWQEGASEIEFLLDIDGNIIPVEVKSGHVTQAKSLKVYSQKYQPKYQIIMSANNLSLHNQAYHYPLYLAARCVIR